MAQRMDNHQWMHYVSDRIDRLHVKSIHSPRAFIADDWYSARRYDHSACIRFWSLTGRKNGCLQGQSTSSSTIRTRIKRPDRWNWREKHQKNSKNSVVQTWRASLNILTQIYREYWHRKFGQFLVIVLRRGSQRRWLELYQEIHADYPLRSVMTLSWWTRVLDICEEAKFPKSNKFFRAVLVKLKKEGKCNVKHNFFWYGENQNICSTGL